MEKDTQCKVFHKTLTLHAILLWGLGVISIFSAFAELNVLVSALLVSFSIFSIFEIRRSILCVCLLIATTIFWLALTYGVEEAILDGLSRASIFPAFLITLVLLRTTADSRPETKRAQHAFAALPENARSGGIITGSHIIGAILQVGVFAILAPIVGKDKTEEERRSVFIVAARGLALVPFWSPFIVGMALASEYLPSVPLWQPVLLGSALTTFCLFIAICLFENEWNPSAILQTLRSLGPIIPSVFFAAATIICISVFTKWSTLHSLIIGLPIPCFFALLNTNHKNIRSGLQTTLKGARKIGPETTLLSLAITLGTVFEAAMPQSGALNWLNAFALTSSEVIFIVITVMIITGLLGIHAIVPGTILLVIFVNIPTGVNDLILMQSLLVGWGLCTLISLGSLTVITGSVMFNLSPFKVITLSNVTFALVVGGVSALILCGINNLLM